MVCSEMALPRARSTLAISGPHLPQALFAAVIAAATLASCGESPVGPKGVGERIPFGQAIEAEVSDSAVRSYSFVADSGTQYSVAVDALQGAVQVIVLDSLRQQWVGSVVVDPSALTPGPGAVVFQAFEAAVFIVQVRAARQGTAARCRFQVARINPLPESVPAAFAVGDTVKGESLTPVGDLDVFQTHGTPGQEIVAVFEALGPEGSGALRASLTPLPAGGGVGSWVVGPGHPATETSGRIAFPASGLLQLAFSASTGITPLYEGPYRFWTYAIDAAPEHRAAAVALSTVVGGERIDRSGDVDEFVFTLGAGDEINAFLQAPRAFRLEIAPQSGATLATVVDAAPADTSLFAASTGRFQVQQAGTYVARVSGGTLIADTGAYRIFLYPIDRRPEHVPQAVTPGDTVAGESIDLPGDVDEFTFSAAAGEEFNAFLQARDGSPDTHLILQAVDADGTVLGTASSAGSDSSLLRQVTGSFATRAAGTHLLRVMGAPFGAQAWSSGPYRLFLYRVNRQPETHAATLAFGDSVLDESLDLPGDVDEFRVVVPDSSGANLVVAVPASSPGASGMRAQLVNASTGTPVMSATRYGAGSSWSGPTSLGPGTYTLRVDAADPQSLARGPYRLWLYRFRFGPEVAHDTIAIGDTIATEALAPPGDVDGFVFYGTRRQQINVALAGRAPAAPGAGFAAFLSGVGANYGPWAEVWSPASSTVLTDHQTLRLELPYTGWYHLGVSGWTSPSSINDRGPYTLAVTPVGTAPETAGAALVPGDSVTTESLDAPGDIDEFHVTATPGQDISVLFASSTPPSSSTFPYVRILDPATGETLDSDVGQGTRIAGPVRVPAGGMLTIAIDQPVTGFRQCSDAACNGVYSVTGPYSFSVIAVNRAPETVSATYVQGDTVRGEALWPIGDFDEFNGSGTPGDTLRAWLRILAAPLPANTMITIEIVDPATRSVIAGGMSVFAPSAEFFPGSPFVVPASGTYLIRVRGNGGFGEDLGTAPYEFFVKRGP